MELLLAAKIISMFTLGLATWIIGLVPLIAVKRGWLSRKESDGDSRLGTVLSCLMCFGGGVIMTSSLAHMLPDVNEVLDLSLEHGTFPDTGQPFCYFAVIFMIIKCPTLGLPVAEILVLAGFLFIYTMEELLHMILVCTGNIQVNNIHDPDLFLILCHLGGPWTQS